MTTSEDQRPQWTNYSPTTGEPIAHYFYSTSEEIESGLQLLTQEFSRFSKLLIHERTDGILRFARLLEKHKGTLAQLMAQEMGKPLRQGLAEIEKCIFTCEHYSEMGERYLMSQELSSHYGQTWVVKRPLGIILAVMPWNFPFWQVIRCAIPAWLSGNVILLKHAPLVYGCAQWIQEMVKEAFSGGSPLLQLPMRNEQTEAVISDPRVRAVSFTGSTQVGRRLASIAGLYLKKTVLELGGSDPYIVLEDADIELAARLCVKARFINSGQSCVAAKRFFIHQSVYAEFKAKVIAQIKALNIGDPTDERTDIGPLAEARFQQELTHKLSKSLEQGAQLILGGSVMEPSSGTKGYFFEPTLLENVTSEMPVFAEECFGPIMPLMPVSSAEQAVFLANQSPFGLGAAIFTRCLERAWRFATEDLDVGMVAINDLIQSDPRVPFGGVKSSGWGRELGAQGVLEFVNLKTVGVAKNLF